MWHSGTLEIGKSIFTYYVKVYGEGSSYGIEDGRISKLMLKRGNKVLSNYDRGWEIRSRDPDAKLALESLKEMYN